MADPAGVEWVDLLESADSTTPPRGVTRILRVGGVTYQRVDGAAKTALGGGASGQEAASLAWLATIAAFAAAKDPTLVNVAYRNNLSDWSTMELGSVTGTTGRATLVQLPTGLVALKLFSGTGATSFQQVRAPRTRAVAAGASIVDNPIANARTTPFLMACRCIVDAVNVTANMPILNMTDEATADAYLGVVGATSQVNFSQKIGAAAAVDTGVAIGTLGTTEHDLIMWSDGTNYRAYIDGNTTAVATTLSANAANGACHLTSYPNNQATATNVGHRLTQWAIFTA
jgi:hypothetical protein